MSEEESKALHRRFVDQVINNSRVDEIPGLYSDAYVDHTAPPGAPSGLDGVRGLTGQLGVGSAGDRTGPGPADTARED